MSDCKEKGKTSGNTDLTSISSVIGIILGIFGITALAARRLPPGLLNIGKRIRPGMSARNLAARTIARLESESGLPMGDVFADGPNRESIKIKVMAEEMVSMIQTEAIAEVGIDPGAIQVTGTGFAGPVPVVIQGSNVLPVTGGGGLR
tara:strand:+ start:884 stop:1327 length:444 start_codon:yes stop_codon:yes gene_type:complete